MVGVGSACAAGLDCADIRRQNARVVLVAAFAQSREGRERRQINKLEISAFARSDGQAVVNAVAHVEVGERDSLRSAGNSIERAESLFHKLDVGRLASLLSFEHDTSD